MRSIEVNDIKSLTKYERARMIGSRALQISLGAPILINLTKAKLKEIRFNPVEIAKLEFDEGKIPIMIRRPLP
jgi:DNA-directed RNA polymerase subunit K/omega